MAAPPAPVGPRGRARTALAIWLAHQTDVRGDGRRVFRDRRGKTGRAARVELDDRPGLAQPDGCGRLAQGIARCAAQPSVLHALRLAGTLQPARCGIVRPRIFRAPGAVEQTPRPPVGRQYVFHALGNSVRDAHHLSLPPFGCALRALLPRRARPGVAAQTVAKTRRVCASS